MATQLQLALHESIYTIRPRHLESKPLSLGKLLNLIMLADDCGYSVKTAHEMNSGNHPVLSDIYTVWFAIENEIPVFAHNITALIEFIAWKYSGEPSNGSIVDVKQEAA